METNPALVLVRNPVDAVITTSRPLCHCNSQVSLGQRGCDEGAGENTHLMPVIVVDGSAFVPDHYVEPGEVVFAGVDAGGSL